MAKKWFELKKLPSINDEEKLDLLSTDGMLINHSILITENDVVVGFKGSELERECRID